MPPVSGGVLCTFRMLCTKIGDGYSHDDDDDDDNDTLASRRSGVRSSVRMCPSFRPHRERGFPDFNDVIASTVMLLVYNMNVTASIMYVLANAHAF